MPLNPLQDLTEKFSISYFSEVCYLLINSHLQPRRPDTLELEITRQQQNRRQASSPKNQQLKPPQQQEQQQEQKIQQQQQFLLTKPTSQQRQWIQLQLRPKMVKVERIFILKC